jgi:hypothetical protein
MWPPPLAPGDLASSGLSQLRANWNRNDGSACHPYQLKKLLLSLSLAGVPAAGPWWIDQQRGAVKGAGLSRTFFPALD